MLPKSETLQRRVYFYVLEISADFTIHTDLKAAYKNYGANYDNEIQVV